MKRLWLCAALLLSGQGFSQGIRKNFTEMTAAEQDAYVGALNRLPNALVYLDVVQDIERWWTNSSYVGIGPNMDCSTSQYLPFMRMTLWEMENALQHKNPKLTVPYWNWMQNNSPSDGLFTSFVPQSRIPWTFSRDLGVYNANNGIPLPTASDVASVQTSSVFCDDYNYDNSFRERLENEVTWNGLMWLGGNSYTSTLDPASYMYHAMIDKIWSQWSAAHSYSYPHNDINVLNRYDGSTGGAYVSPLPLINNSNVDSIVDNRRTGIFYSENDTALLSGGSTAYSVANRFMTPEYFAYPKQIVASNFTIPSGKSAVFVSETGVTLQPGFDAEGSLEIDIGASYYDNFPLSKAGAKKPFDRKAPGATGERFSIVHSSAGFTARLWLENASSVRGFIVGLDGKTVASVLRGEQLEAGYHEIQLNVPKGHSLYYARFQIGDEKYQQLLPRL